MDQKLRHLGQVGYFVDIDRQEFSKIAAASRLITFRRGDLINDVGRLEPTLHIIGSGTVALSVVSADGREKLLNIFKPGEILGELVHSEHAERRSRTRGVAVSDGWMLAMNRERFIALCQRYAACAARLIEDLTHKVAHAYREIEELTFLSARHRFAGLLVRLCEEHGVKMEQNKWKLEFSQRFLANALGVSLTRLSNIVRWFKREQLIEQRTGIYLSHWKG